MPVEFPATTDFLPHYPQHTDIVENDARFLLAVADYLDADEHDTDVHMNRMWNRYVLCVDHPDPEHFVSSVMDGILYHSLGLVGYCWVHDQR